MRLLHLSSLSDDAGPVLCSVSITRTCPVMKDGPGMMARSTCLHYIFGNGGLLGWPWGQRSSWSISYWKEWAWGSGLLSYHVHLTTLWPWSGGGVILIPHHRHSRGETFISISLVSFSVASGGCQDLGNLFHRPKSKRPE